MNLFFLRPSSIAVRATTPFFKAAGFGKRGEAPDGVGASLFFTLNCRFLSPLTVVVHATATSKATLGLSDFEKSFHELGVNLRFLSPLASAVRATATRAIVGCSNGGKAPAGAGVAAVAI